jgi:hypothetical protein
MKSEDWITQAEAARLRNVTPQAITSLIATARVRTINFGGRLFVSREDVAKFKALPRGRKAKK